MYTWTQWKNFLKMMERRGYDVDDEKEMTYDEWDTRFFEEEGKFIEPFIFCDHLDGGKLIMVFFLPATNVALSHISMFTSQMNEENIDHGIIVHVNDWTYYAKAALNMDSSKHFFEKIHVDFFNFDRMEHEWQPEYQLMTKSEAAKLCSALNVSPYQFPILKKEQVVCSYWGWQKKRGRLVKIIDYDGGEKHINYRVIE
jgi:DNA-directed RNA polymerase subunit H (RpoH/RPB5)